MQEEKQRPFKIDDEEVIQALRDLEEETYFSTGIRKISGGFANAEIVNQDWRYFDVELRWGVQSDCENNVHTEQYKLDKRTLILQDN